MESLNKVFIVALVIAILATCFALHKVATMSLETSTYDKYDEVTSHRTGPNGQTMYYYADGTATAGYIRFKEETL